MWIWLRGSDSRIPPCSQYVRVLLTRRPWSRIAAVVAVYWLAGILEGEGSFLAGPPSAPSCPAIRLPMTDPDIVVRVARLFQRAAVATRPRQSHHKTAHVTTIKGAGAALLMQWLAPLLSPRRNRQIERALRCRDSEARRRPRTQIVSLNEELVTEGTEVQLEGGGPSRTYCVAGRSARRRRILHCRQVRQPQLSQDFSHHGRPRRPRARDDPHAREPPVRRQRLALCRARLERGLDGPTERSACGRDHERSPAMDGTEKDIHDRTRTPRMASHSFDSRACDLHRGGLRTTASWARPLSRALHELVARPREGPHPPGSLPSARPLSTHAFATGRVVARRGLRRCAEPS